jgi:DNA polymerase-3 subunit delta'
MLLSGSKGLGKSTFAYHFINYLLSDKEESNYRVESFKINANNSSYKLIQNNIHPNFFLLGNDLSEDNIKIDQVRNLLIFLHRSTFTKDLKIVFIDNAEFLNVNSSNALLKSLEEPSSNTFFFIIHNDASEIKETIKSRCIQFKFHLNIEEKKNIFKKITQDYQLNFNYNDLDKFFYFESPGNLLKYLIALKDSNFNILENNLPCILFLIDKYKTKKDSELLNLITLLIENFYNKLALNDGNNINNYFTNKNKILYLINDMKKFNLDKKNLFITIDNILKNEAQ